MRKYSDEEISRLLYETMRKHEVPSEALNRDLKNQLMERAAILHKRSQSVWWLPALSGCFVSMMIIMFFLLFVGNSLILTTAIIILGLFNLSAWGLTIIGIKYFNLIKEAKIT